jgi:ATP-dependent DNA ligase
MITIKPMLCKLLEKPFNSPDYIWEPKLDGERLTVLVKAPNIVQGMWARSGREKAYMYPDLKFEVKADILLDGEVKSITNRFNDIQHRANRQNGIAQAAREYPVEYSVFDTVQLNELSLKTIPLMHRKNVLKTVVVETDTVKLTPWTEDGVALFDLMKQNELEGVVGKSKTGFYRENKREWFKVKCWQEGVFHAVGYTAGTGWRASTFGALVLADMKGNYVGSVGTGFTEEDIRNLMKQFLPGHCPFAREPEPATWFLPFQVKIRYLEITNDGMLRFPAFKGVV